MRKHTFLRLALVVAVAVIGVSQGYAQTGKDKPKPPKRISQAERKAAAKRARAKRLAAVKKGITAAAAPVQLLGGVPDYFSIDYANWAFSPPLTKFVDPLPGLCTANGPAKCISVAVPNTTAYPGSDYYEIELGEYTEKMHSELNPSTLRGYRQTNTNDPFASQFHYLGPVIVAQKDRPVRIKFTNNLPTGAAGKLFLPVDTTVLGAGPGPNAWANGPTPGTPANAICPSDQPLSPTPANCFNENRATIHLHGGKTPWISDGTPHQWITPTGDATANIATGASLANVSDMPQPPPGANWQTFYYTNQQSARLMFYHDHASGITRLNVYAGEAAGYIITDPMEQALINGGTIQGRTYAAGTIPAATETIPLVIQDKTFVDATLVPSLADPNVQVPRIKNTDPLWMWGPYVNGTRTVQTGDLWWPHVYVPAQNPYDLTGINPTGRWVYGPWFWPPTNNIMFPPVPNPYYDCGAGQPCTRPWEPPEMPGTPNVSWGGEAFMDTPVVNGTAYPKLSVQAKPYRFRILNAAHDRFWNLQLYQATAGIVSSIAVTNPGSGYTEAPEVTIAGGSGKGATAVAVIDDIPGSPTLGQVTGVEMLTVGTGYAASDTLTVTIAPPTTPGGVTAQAAATIYAVPTEVGMLPAIKTAGFPALWPADGRDGGTPDPALRGPAFVQIGTEGGFLPAPVVVKNQPVTWNRNPTTFNAGNVQDHALLLGPAERADVIVDFAPFAGRTLILYNDAPAAFPALDARLDYYTANPDFSMQTGDGSGGNTPTLPGKGPNTRTIMQIEVAGTPTTTPGPVDWVNTTVLAALQNAFKSDATGPGVFAAGQEPIIVGQDAYGTGAGNTSAYNVDFPAVWPFWGVSRIQDNSMSIQTPAGTQLTLPMQPKAIHDEMGAAYDEYGRMSAKLGLEVPFTGNINQTFILQNYVDPPTEIVAESMPGVVTPGDGTQIWKITHNGVDTHPIHFHIFDVQLLNRVGWDGAIRLPDPNELGWKDTVRISPLEDTIVALRPVAPKMPFGIPDSVRPLDPALPLGATAGFTNLDQYGQPLATPTVNVMYNFGWEYVWHCHILSHEEADMMRPIQLDVARILPDPPIVSSQIVGNTLNLTWTDGTPVIDPNNPANLGNAANEIGFRIEQALVANNGRPGPYSTVGSALANVTQGSVTIPTSTSTYTYRVVAYNAAGDSPSAPVMVGPPIPPPAAPTALTGTLQAGPKVALTWQDNANNETGFQIERAIGAAGAFSTLATVAARNGTGSVSYTDSAVAAGVTYRYRVRAVNAVANSAYSNTFTVAITSSPAAPSNFVASSTLNATGRRAIITLNWSDNANNETGFTIQRAENGAFTLNATTFNVGANTTTLTQTGLFRGVTYYYRIRSYNGSGTSAWVNASPFPIIQP